MKKFAALLLCAVLVFSFCGCGEKAKKKDGKASTVDSSQSASVKIDSPHVGTWRMESYDTQDQKTKNFRLYAHLELNEDGTFVVKGRTIYSKKAATIDSDPSKEQDTATGTYTIDGDKVSFTALRQTDGYVLQDLKEPIDFTGEVKKDGKLYCVITDHKVVFVKE